MQIDYLAIGWKNKIWITCHGMPLYLVHRDNTVFYNHSANLNTTIILQMSIGTISKKNF